MLYTELVFGSMNTLGIGISISNFQFPRWDFGKHSAILGWLVLCWQGTVSDSCVAIDTFLTEKSFDGF